MNGESRLAAAPKLPADTVSGAGDTSPAELMLIVGLAQ